jgi:hypothetical protein
MKKTEEDEKRVVVLYIYALNTFDYIKETSGKVHDMILDEI